MATIQNKGGNKWILMVSDGFGINNKRRRPTRSFEGTENQANKAAILFEEEVKNGKYKSASKKYTLSQFVEIWIQDYGEPHLAPKTLARYKEMLDSRILPTIGHLKLEAIKPMTVNRLMNELAEMPRLDKKPGKLSAQTIKHHFRCLSAILQDAVDWEVINENPCSRVKPPKVPKAKIKVYDEEETGAFLVALEKAPLKHRTLIWMEIATGLREGEIMGLEWTDIDFEKLTLRVERASQYLPGKNVFTKEPKNAESKRVLALPENVVSLLKQYKAEWNARKLKLGNLWQVTGALKLFKDIIGQGIKDQKDQVEVENAGNWKDNMKSLRNVSDEIRDKLAYFGDKASLEIAILNTFTDKQLEKFHTLWEEKKITIPGNRLFTTWDGCPGYPAWPTQWLTKFLKENKLPHCSFHSLRHLNATLSIKAGVPLKNVSARLGHSDIGTTANIYTEVLKSVDREAANLLGDLLKNSGKKTAQKQK